jgi:predicted PurR-regulated permease PerM
VVVVAGLYLARVVLLPITLAVLLSFVLAPLANLLRHLRLCRVPSVLFAAALAVGIVMAIGTVIGSQVAVLGVHYRKQLQCVLMPSRNDSPLEWRR